MLILIAESKTMTDCSATVDGNVYEKYKPAFAEETDKIMRSLEGNSAEELSESVKISMPMARKLYNMIYDFPDKSHGSKAIEAFTGVVFKAFDYHSLDDTGKDSTNDHVRIVSSLYGWLKPDDIIKSYRFDFTTPLATGGKTFASFWKDAVTKRLLEELSNSGCKDILNLLPTDAAKSIDWKRVKAYAKTWKVDFKEITDGGAMRTPNAGKLKTLRGKLLRQIIAENITNPEVLLHLSGNDYVAAETQSSSDTILFHTA